MSVLWVLPIVVVALGMTAVAAVSWRAARAADELRRECAGLSELGEHVSALHADALAVRHSIEQLREPRLLTDSNDR